MGTALLVLIAAPALAQQSTWQEIQQSQTLKLGVTQSPPWSQQDPQTGKWTGLSVALGQQIAKAMGVKLKLVPVTWSTAVAALKSSKIDTMFVLDPTPERAMSVNFTLTPMFYYGLAVLHGNSIQATTWADLNKPSINIGVTLGTSIDRFVTAELPNAHISRYPNNDDTVASFQSGRSNVVAMFAPALTMLQRKVGTGQITVPRPAHFSATAAGVRREADPTWLNFLTTTLEYYYNSGETEKLYDQYLKAQGIDPSTVPGLMKASLTGAQ
ncbi:MAG: transporter substrate-binding domain-containing protein [Deinococcales bacterium]